MRLKIFAIAFFFISTGNACGQVTLMGQSLNYTSLGPIKLGMSQKQLKGMGFKLTEEPSGYDECVEVDPHADVKINVMLENDKISRISSYDSLIKTIDGLSVGATEKQVIKLYGARLQVHPHQYDENGHYLVVKSQNGKFAFVYETDGKRVTGIHSGLEGSAQYVEGCL